MRKRWTEALSSLAGRRSRIVIGVMSGTSANAIDAAVCAISGGGAGKNGAKARLLGFVSKKYPPAIQKMLLNSANLTIRETAELHCKIGDLFGRTCRDAMKNAGLKSGQVHLIGSHGQTVYHHSGNNAAQRCTLQLGDGDRIAELTGATVISDFRSRDIACGGEGAPLTPYADLILYREALKNQGRGVLVLNLGGIANITVLHEKLDRITGFDTGPANSILDRLSRTLTRGRAGYDADGAMARKGTVDEKFLKQLLREDRYLHRGPPKSTGFEMYGDEFVRRLIKRHGGADWDLLATATEFVAQSIALSIKKFVAVKTRPCAVIVAGGGARNSFLIERLGANLLSVPVLFSEDFGVPAEAREAMAFAILANETLLGIASSLPAVTGARRSAVLGKISLPG